MIRARARELNYQVNSFLVVDKPSSQNWMPLNYCDDIIVIRNDEEEANGSTNQFGHQDYTTRKHKIRHQVQTSSSYSQATSNWFGNISQLRMLFEAWVLIGNIVKSTFKLIQPHYQIPPETFCIYQKTFIPLVLGWQLCNLFGPLGAHIVLGFPPPHVSWLPPIYK